MSYTANLLLNKQDRGSYDWDTELNTDRDTIDSAVGNLNTTVDDLPQGYRYADTFNGPTGTVIALPTTVDSTNEYGVFLASTTRAGAIGDIYFTKAVNQVTVHCSEANTTDTFEVVIFYLGDVSSYGGSLYRRYYVSPSTSITDHSLVGTAGSIAYMANLIGASPAVLVLPGNKTYTIDSDIDLTSQPNLMLLFDSGAVMARTTGDEVLTLYSPSNLIAPGFQKITATDMVQFSVPGQVSAEWFNGDIQAAIDSLPASGGRVMCHAESYALGTTGLTIDKNNLTVESTSDTFVDATKITFSGTGPAVMVGALLQITYNSGIKNINIAAIGAAQTDASAYGIEFMNTHYAVMDRISIEDFGQGVGALYTSDASPQFGATCVLRDAKIHDCKICVRVTGTDGFAKMNHLYVDGGFFSATGKAASGSIAFDLQVYSDSTIIANCDIENAEIGIKSAAANTRMMAPRMEECGTGISVQATGYYNTIIGAQYSNCTTNLSDGGFETKNVEFNDGKYYSYNNLVPNGSFERWSDGIDVEPDGWTLGGTGAVAMDTDYQISGLASVKLTNGVGQTSVLYRDIADLLPKLKGKWLRLTGWIKTATASNARVRILSDSITGGYTPSAPGYSDQHSGSDDWELLNTYTYINTDATTLVIYLSADAASSVTYFDDIMVCEGKEPTLYIPQMTENLEEILDTDQEVCVTDYYLTKLDTSIAPSKPYFYLGNGHYIGQQKRVVLIDATYDADFQVSQHETSTPEVFTFSGVGAYLILEWTGSFWVTVFKTASVTV